MAGDRSDEELGRTATEAGSDPGPAPRDSAPLGAELGRYRLQRELGRGGMGVVHAAFDPDLERRVALKVLRSADAVEARQRLLREARAMARVTHSNVVAVHEVGSVDGRDYIAMELIDGGTLEEWLASPHREREIVEAFAAAGRGLAAAHAAGLVHRDFKPHNVLRRTDGRIVVTDFGLVVGVETIPDALTATLRAADVDRKTTPSSLSGLTATGSLLGTPAYMAPEQWMGGAVGPHTDQFAFCVALWEALARERPFGAMNLEDLKADVCAGKHGDEAKLPRRFRKILVRGLDPDPKKRWPSMDALLAALARADRKPWVAFSLGGVALVAAAVTVGIVTHHGSAGATCEAPATDPAIVWSSNDATALRAAHQDLAATAIDHQMNEWLQARSRACKAPAPMRPVQLACLDGVLARTSAIKDAVLTVKSGAPLEINDELIKPSLCEGPTPPRLVHPFSKELRAVFAGDFRRDATGETLDDVQANEVLNAAWNEPCASAYAHLVAEVYKSGDAHQRELDEAEGAAERCGDDRVRADVALAAARSSIDRYNSDVVTRVKRAEAFVERVEQPELSAKLEEDRAFNAVKAERIDETIERFQRAIGLFQSSGMIRAATRDGLQVVRFRLRRGTPDDLAAVPRELEDLRRQIVAKVPETDRLVRQVDRARASWLWSLGQIADADALRARAADPYVVVNPRTVTGRVFDETGAPVSGADVAVSTLIVGDSLHVQMPGGDTRSTRTAAGGQFVIRDVDAEGFAIAQLGDRRSKPISVGTAELTLTLAPTSRITGTVALNGVAPQLVSIDVEDASLPIAVPYAIQAPVLPDGSFSVDGVPRGRMRVRTSHQGVQTQDSAVVEVVVAKPVVDGIKLAVKAGGRQVRMLVRSSFGLSLQSALVVVVRGRQASTNMQVLFEKTPDIQTKLAWPLTPQDDAPSVHVKSKPGDLFALAGSVPDGEASACAAPLPDHMDDEATNKTMNKPGNLAKIPVTCVAIPPADDIVVVEVQPWPRLE